MPSIDPSYYLQNQQARGTASSSLGKDDFLKILMAQIQNQNPLDPMKDKEFISQMAQFSNLEQMTNMSQAMQQFMDSQNSPPVIQFSGLIGREVSYSVVDSETGLVEGTEQGVVHAVSQKDGKTFLELSDGEKISVNDITRVSDRQDSV